MIILLLFFRYLFFISHLEIALSSILSIAYIRILLLWSHQAVAYLLWEDNLPLMMINSHLADFIGSLILGLDHSPRKYILKKDSLYSLQDLLWKHSKSINAFIFGVIWYFLLKLLFFLLLLLRENYPKLQLLEPGLTTHFAALLIVIEYFTWALVFYLYYILYWQLFLRVIDEDHFLLGVC